MGGTNLYNSNWKNVAHIARYIEMVEVKKITGKSSIIIYNWELSMIFHEFYHYFPWIWRRVILFFSGHARCPLPPLPCPVLDAPWSCPGRAWARGRHRLLFWRPVECVMSGDQTWGNHGDIKWNHVWNHFFTKCHFQTWALNHRSNHWIIESNRYTIMIPLINSIIKDSIKHGI